jgi:UDP-glucose 4-epimerase
MLALRDRYPITGIVHLGGALSTPADELRTTSAALANVLEAAATWQVRACIASAIGIYGSVAGAWREDAEIPLLGTPHPIVAMKKAAEIYVELAAAAGIACIAMRIAAIYGPRYLRARSVPTRIARATARGRALDLEGVWWGAAPDDGADWCYVKDCARAIALLATAPALAHRVYNVGSGLATRNGDFAAAARRLVPDAQLGAYAVSASPAPIAALDITRLATDTGYAPRFDAESGLADYLAWLADHEH